MRISNGKSSGGVMQNGGKSPIDVGGLSRGYCGFHDTSYRLAQGDETCPRCDKWQAQDLAWGDQEDAHYHSGDDMGDSDEE